MNLFDELGGITPRTEGGLNRRGDKQQQEIIDNHLQTENGLGEEGIKNSKKQDIPTGWTRFIKLAYYVQYFQVSESEVIDRIRYSISVPYQAQFLAVTHNSPDFYGPFWILTTLIMLLGFVGEIWDKYFFKLEFIREALILIYTFGFGVPVAIYFILKLKAERLELELPNLICLYGYSLFCFIPAVVVCILPISFVQWLCLLYGLVNSSIFLKVSLVKYANGISEYVLVSVIAGAQFIFILCLKFIFLKLLSP